MNNDLWPKTLAGLNETEQKQMIVVLLGMLSAHHTTSNDDLFSRAYVIAQKQLRGRQ